MLTRNLIKLTHPEASVLPVIVPHIIVHDFIETVTDVVNSKHVHTVLSIKSYKNKIFSKREKKKNLPILTKNKTPVFVAKLRR